VCLSRSTFTVPLHGQATVKFCQLEDQHYSRFAISEVQNNSSYLAQVSLYMVAYQKVFCHILALNSAIILPNFHPPFEFAVLLIMLNYRA